MPTKKPATHQPNTHPERKKAAAHGAAFPVVGVGASAGGLEALRGLLGSLPDDTGMAFVIVQHLAPAHESAFAEILSRSTKMPVNEVSDESVVEPNHVYVIPPGRDMTISGGRLLLLAQERNPVHRGIDHFFRSLAEDSAHHAIGVVLSGSATDGTLGLEVIKAEGGVTFAQDESAQHGSMPKSAVASGCVDFVLPPEGIAKEIARISRHPYIAWGAEEKVESHGGEHGHERIAEIVRRVTGVDFTHYKANTMQRRIERRMMVRKIEKLAEYEAHLRATPAEVEALYQDVLINVTSFFRNPDAFETLAKDIFPKLLAGRTRHDPVRIWTLGCSTGEEAYSLAILFAECAEAAKSTAVLQMFASDLNASCIDKARMGRYPRGIAAEVSPERLRKYFVEEDGTYRVNKSIRERVVFSRHNVLTDPPFSRMDFISCRNLLIYLEPVLQQHVLPLMHYALKPGGHLWLGSSESLGNSRGLFEVEDARQKIFVRKPGPTPPGTRYRPQPDTAIFPPPLPGPRETPATQLHRDAERLLLAKYVPPGVVVNSALDVVQFRGDTGAFLAPAAGVASHGLLKMLREGLLVPVRTALARADHEGTPVREEGVRVTCLGGYRELAIAVIPLHANAGHEAGYAILFDEGPGEVTAPAKARRRKAEAEDENEITRLTQELAATREFLQSVIEQQDAANEELQSVNEEAQSANEEMQSVNEELETSKEEIQSSNEELATVNDELNHRNLELNDLSNDLTNVLSGTNLSILIVTRDLRLRRFTPAAEKVLNLSGGDVGRPLADIRLSLTMPGLAPLLSEVMETLSPRERDVQDALGRWYSMRARPYLTHDHKVEGAVVTLVDVDALRRAHDYAQSIVGNVRGPLVVLDDMLRVKSASPAFYAHFKVVAAQTEGRLIYDLGNRQWNIPALRTLLEEVLPQEHEVVDYEVCHTFESIGPRVMLLNARRLAQAPDSEALIILSIEDVTERQQSERALREQSRLLDLTSDAIMVRNAEGLIVYWNAGAEKLFGWTREEALGKSSHDLLKTECPVLIDQITEALHRDGHWTGEFVQTKRDGERITVLVRKSLDRDSEGNTDSVLVTLTDISERLRAEAALRRSELRFRTAVTTVSNLIWTNNAEGKMEGEQPGWENFTGQTQEEYQGYGWSKAVHPEDAQPTIDAWDQAVAEKRTFIFEHRVRRADGEWRLCSVRAAPVLGEDGAILEWVGVHNDITEQKRSEETLRRSEERHRALITASSDVVYQMNADWSEVAPLDGRDLVASSAVPNRDWLEENIFPEDQPQILAAIDEAVRTKSLFKMEHRVRRPNGGEGWTVSRAVPLCDAHGEIVEWFGTASDVTERHLAGEALAAHAAELARADRSKDEFLAMLAHELRNPLAPLRNASEILRSTDVSADERTHAQNILDRQIENMSRMIDDLLDVSRITEGKIELRKKAVSLESILTAATSLARSGCAAHSQDLALTLPAEPVWLNADATRLEQVFGNLLTNACKYSGVGSHIVIRAERMNGEVSVSVCDDGAGISPELLPHIFDLFVQASRTLDRAHGGLGIGLTLVQRLVNLHGGSIEAYSDGLGHGAEFIVRLPILAEAPPAPAPTPRPAQETPRRILIVDDNTDSARSLAILQSRRGHETRTAFTGPDALTAAAEFLPEVVLLDIGLPGMDGFEVARNIRTMPALKGALLIAMSGYGRDEDRAEAKLAGFDEYMVKPVELTQLREWLREWKPKR